jgi:hypothetical protein
MFGPITEMIHDLVGELERTLDPAGQLIVRDKMATLADIDAAIAAADDHESFCDAVKHWGQALLALAEVLLAPLLALGVAGAPLVGNLLVYALRKKFPRLGVVLTLAGVIVDDPSTGGRFDFAALARFVSDPPALVDETFWDDTFDAQDVEGTGRAPALLLALLLMAPDTISALRRGQTRIAALDPPPVRASAAAQWRELRERSAGWIPVTFPMRTEPDGTLTLPVLSELRGDFAAELALSVLIRSQRRVVGSRPVTDFELWLHPSADAPKHELRSAGGTFLHLDPGVRAGFGYDGEAGVWNGAVRSRGGDLENEAVLALGRDTADSAPDILIGAPYDTRIVVQDIGATLTIRESGTPHVEALAHIDGFAVVLTNRWLRTLGEANTSLREGLRFDLDLAARIADGSGFSLKADGGLSATWHLNKSKSLKVLTLKVHSLSVFARIRGSEDHLDVRAEVRAHLSAVVGPLTLVLDGAGGWVGWWADEPGGDKHCIGALPPTGAGAQLDISGVTVGGFLDFTGGPNERYAGVVSVAIGPPKGSSGFSVTGFGVHELLGNPEDDVRRRSVVVVLGATFRPGLPVGWGLSLVGVGGIVGINRRADTDALRERLTSGAVSNILFADDPIRNAPVLLGDLNAIFPPREGSSVIGITCRLQWLGISAEESFVRIGIGVIIELPGPSRIAIIGAAQIRVPDFESVLNLEIDVVGVVDLVRKTFELDATILRGKLLKLFVITGDAAVRVSWGDQPYMMATLGGFHPDFHPQPAVFPKLTKFRLALEHQDVLPKALSLAGEGYLAVTTNTIQAGLDFIATISAGNWNIQGKIGGDALVRLPFFFDISLHGSVAVRWKSHSIAAVKLKGGLTGIRPLVLYGELCLEFLFFDVCYSGSWELNATDLADAALTQTLLPIVEAELDAIANLSADDSTDPHVRLEFAPGGARPVYGVLGTLMWRQHRVPLDMTLTQFEGSPLAAPQRLVVTAAGATPYQDWFSPGQFVQLSAAEQLALPSFERHTAGVVLAADETTSAPLDVTIEVEEFRLPAPPRRGADLGLHDNLLQQLHGRDAALTVPADDAPRFRVSDDAFRVDGTDLHVSAVQAYVQAGSTATQHRADRLVGLVG